MMSAGTYLRQSW